MLSRGGYIGRALMGGTLLLGSALLFGACASGSENATSDATPSQSTNSTLPSMSSSAPSDATASGPLMAPTQLPTSTPSGSGTQGSGGTGGVPTPTPVVSAQGGSSGAPPAASSVPDVIPTSEPTASTDPTADPETEPGASASTGVDTGSESDAGATPPQVDAPVDLSKATEEPLTNLLSVRQEHSVVALDGEIYIIGGYNPQATDSVEAYDTQTMTWRTSTSFPEVMNHGNAGVIDGKIYVAGYYIDGTMSDATTKVYAYDPLLEEWAERTPLPEGTERAASCVCVDSGLLYVIAGAKNGMSVDTSSRYDAAADSWEALPPLPERREHCVAGVINGTLYIGGGRADAIEGIEEKTWALDLSEMQWVERAPLVPPRGGLAGAALRGRLFLFGGEGSHDSDNGVFPDVSAYDPATDTWEALPPMLVPRHGFGAAVMDDRIYLAGGADRQGGGAADDNSVFYIAE